MTFKYWGPLKPLYDSHVLVWSSLLTLTLEKKHFMMIVWQIVRLFRLLIGSSSYFPSSLFFWEPTGYFPYYCEAAAAVALDNELTFPAFLSEPGWVHKGLTSPNHLSFVAALATQKMANDTYIIRACLGGICNMFYKEKWRLRALCRPTLHLSTIWIKENRYLHTYLKLLFLQAFHARSMIILSVCLNLFFSWTKWVIKTWMAPCCYK